MIVLSRVIVFLSLFFIAFATQAANPLDVIINEAAWMGTTNSANDEWIELYNNTDVEIDLSGWGLYEEGGKTLVEPLIGIIGAKSYYLIERTDDNTVPDIEASQSPTGWGGYGLNNNGEHLQLLDNSSNIIDEVDCSGGWFTGIGKPEYKTMERINSLVGGSDPQNWQTSQNPGGTSKAKNSEQNQELKIAEDVPPPISLTESEKPALDNSRQQTYPSGIVINEILPSPEGPDETEEWIEIFNQNNFEVDLSGWQIADTVGRTTTYIFPVGTKISPQGFLVLWRPTTKITLNNSQDGLLLIQPNGNILDSVNYQKAPRGQSYNKTENGWVWSSLLTQGSINITSLPATQNEIGQKEKVEPNKELQKNQFQKQQLADIGEQLPKAFNSLHIFLIALGLAVFSGIIILLLKKRVKNLDFSKKLD